MFASQHRLANLVALVDVNGQQALGKTAEIIDLEPLADRWRSFGWNVLEVDGHDEDRIGPPSTALDRSGDQPHVVLLRTTFGKGVSFMESNIQWHYRPIDGGPLRAGRRRGDGAAAE